MYVRDKGKGGMGSLPSRMGFGGAPGNNELWGGLDLSFYYFFYWC